MQAVKKNWGKIQYRTKAFGGCLRYKAQANSAVGEGKARAVHRAEAERILNQGSRGNHKMQSNQLPRPLLNLVRYRLRFPGEPIVY